MTKAAPAKRLGFFTRLLDEASAAERYRLATEQILHAERYGFESAWVAQHHFHEAEGGLPAPLVFLAQVAGIELSLAKQFVVMLIALDLFDQIALDDDVFIAVDLVALVADTAHRLTVAGIAGRPGELAGVAAGDLDLGGIHERIAELRIGDEHAVACGHEIGRAPDRPPHREDPPVQGLRGPTSPVRLHLHVASAV